MGHSAGISVTAPVARNKTQRKMWEEGGIADKDQTRAGDVFLCWYVLFIMKKKISRGTCKCLCFEQRVVVFGGMSVGVCVWVWMCVAHDAHKVTRRDE